MRYRCYNENNCNYKYYGARGINVCKAWNEKFTYFYYWAIGHGYKKGLVLDRINNNGDYTPENCRFVTKRVSSENLRGSLRWFIKGKKFSSIRRAAEHFGVDVKTISHWVYGQKVGGYQYEPKNGCFVEPKYKEVVNE